MSQLNKNYSTQAIKELREFSRGLPEIPTKYIAQELSLLVERGQKFLFPDGGRVFQEGKFVQWENILFNLPYPITIIEYASLPNSTKGVEEYKQKFGNEPIHVYKRISLAVSSEVIAEYPILASLVYSQMKWANDIREPYIVLWPVLWVNGRWIPCWCGAIIEAGTEGLVKPTQEFTVTNLEHCPTDYRCKEFLLVFDPYYREQIEEPIEVLRKNAVYDLGDELIAMKQLCQVLSCENITTTRSRGPIALNKSRMKKGKLPFFDYHVLTVKGVTTDCGVGGHSTHASPRLHWRRGHIRQLASGVRTWVRPTTVGREALGVVQKIYKIPTQI